jgi:hypothetical protein
MVCIISLIVHFFNPLRPQKKTRFVKSHGKYLEEDLDINLSHKVPVTLTDKTAFFAVKCVRLVFDTGERGSSLGISSGCSAN